ncbi:anti-sigma factor RsbA family regulatory protein [Amycolatopsis cynarae]|uniref:Anti-sigma factor RsbA family regulatory protein n=1 Tax=Amycolatopsis cynarae TaxID=2995223 RepID=A0ABY7AWB5_9PSEU|nr:anti-sigma factor RsbA family regulatory protein [Amycolatopsis sp. HUAS 11-8]WAL64307.1 anti-sigma factor RsbA family regulatory protein [Amycolatopsis sp. HUAS 11-8]
MRSGAALGHTGYFHEVSVYSSDEEFLAVTVPFLEEGIDAGEPTIVAFDAERLRLLHSAMDTSTVTVVPMSEQYRRPAVAIRQYRQKLAELTAKGAEQIRVSGQVPHPGTGHHWDWWSRYESAINELYDEFPLWGLCSYDARITPDEVLADVRRTHPFLAEPGGHHHNRDYLSPGEFLPTWRQAPRPAPESGPPFLDLLGPTAAEARQAVRLALAESRVEREPGEDFLMAVSEVVTNGGVHGGPPVRLRIWNHGDRLVATVTDGGTGPADPFVGLVPTEGSLTAGLGLWIAHQVCRHVALYADDEGFAVRLEC